MARSYQAPTKGDLDRNLSMISHEAHHKAQAERARLTNEFAARNMASSTSLIESVVGRLDQIHKESTTQAMHRVHNFIERIQDSPTQVTAWARPHLENMGNTLLGQIPPAGFPAEQQRIRAQYLLVFQQRLDGAIRDVEVGIIDGQSAPSGSLAKEMVSLKPTWYGIGIDLKELARRIKSRIMRRSQ